MIAAQDATGGGAAPIVGATKSDASKRARSIRRPCVRSDSVSIASSPRFGAVFQNGVETRKRRRKGKRKAKTGRLCP